MPIVRPPVRARDLRANIKQLGFEQGVTVTLEGMLEEHSAMKQHMRELTDLVSQCIGQVEQMIRVGDGMTNIINDIKRKIAQGNEHG